MSQRIDYLVLCQKAKARPISELLPTLKMPSGCNVLLEDEDLFVVTELGYEIVASLLTGQTIEIEALEFAEAHGKDPAHREAIARCDARYQVATTLSSFEETFEQMWIVASRLAETCDGMILNTYQGEWVERF